MKLSDLKPDGRLFALFIGDSSSGKTCAELSLPTPGLLLDMDLRARGGLAAKEWLGENFSKWDVEQFPPTIEAIDKVIARVENLRGELAMGVSKYKSLVFNSMTSYTRQLIWTAKELTAPGTKNEQAIKGKKFGEIKIAGPAHYGFEQAGVEELITLLRSLPINVVADCHIVPKYGKPTTDSGKEDTYAENIVVGETLSLRDKVAVNVLIYFDEVYRFEKAAQGGGIQHYVKFRDASMARTAYHTLPHGLVNITGKSFYEVWKQLVSEEKLSGTA